MSNWVMCCDIDDCYIRTLILKSDNAINANLEYNA